jgi:hypothetical protein
MRASIHAIVRERETSWGFSLALTALYASLLVFCHLHHECWRDEIHSFTLARMADGFADIVTGDRVYEGHPPGWFWYLRVFSWFTDQASGLHAATIVAMSAAMLLFGRFAPFPRFVKVLLSCSYVLAYEYGTLSRNYALDWLFVTVACSLHHPLKPRPIASALALGALCFSSAYGAIMACALFPVLLSPCLSMSWVRTPPRRLEVTASPRVVPALLLFGGLLAFSYVASIPPDPNPFSGGWDLSALRGDQLSPALDRLVYSFLPVRWLHARSSWADAAMFWGDHPTLCAWVGAALLGCVTVALLPAWLAAASFIGGVGLMNVLQIARYTGSVRHWAHAVLLFVALLWVSSRERARTKALRAFSSVVLVVIGLFQVESFAAVALEDYHVAFSGGRETAAYIEREGLSNLPIVAGPDWFVITVTGYLRRTFVSVETEEMNQTVVFHARRRAFSAGRLVERGVLESKKRRTPVLILSNDKLPAPADRTVSMPLLFSSALPNMADSEQFFVYRVSP